MGRIMRGYGVKHTLPLLWRFAGLWMLVTVAAVVVASASSFLMFKDRTGTVGDFVGMLAFQTLFIVLAVLGLGVFTTHRLAGPWIAVRRALDDAKHGDFRCRLHIRGTDAYLKGVESSFNELMELCQSRLDGGAGSAPSAPSPPPSAKE